MAVIHVEPVNDLIQHLDNDCPCGPTPELVASDDGPDGWVIVHHSLDGRERFEAQ